MRGPSAARHSGRALRLIRRRLRSAERAIAEWARGSGFRTCPRRSRGLAELPFADYDGTRFPSDGRILKKVFRPRARAAGCSVNAGPLPRRGGELGVDAEPSAAAGRGRPAASRGKLTAGRGRALLRDCVQRERPPPSGDRPPELCRIGVRTILLAIHVLAAMEATWRRGVALGTCETAARDNLSRAGDRCFPSGPAALVPPTGRPPWKPKARGSGWTALENPKIEIAHGSIRGASSG